MTDRPCASSVGDTAAFVVTRMAGRAARPSPRALPAQPLHALINHERRAGASIRDLSERWAVNRRTLQRYLTRSWLRRDAADRIAVAAGRHPSEIWPDWFWEGTK